MAVRMGRGGQVRYMWYISTCCAYHGVQHAGQEARACEAIMQASPLTDVALGAHGEHSSHELGVGTTPLHFDLPDVTGCSRAVGSLGVTGCSRAGGLTQRWGLGFWFTLGGSG